MNDKLFDLEGKVAALTGAGGVLIGMMARELAKRGARVIVMDRVVEAAKKTCEEIRAAGSWP